MKITSFATLAALAFTFNLSASPFALEEVLPDEGDVAFSLPLKIKTENAIREELRSSDHPDHKCNVHFITVRNQTKQTVSLGDFKIAEGKSRLFTQTFDNHEQFKDVSLKSTSPLLLSTLPSALTPQPKLSPLQSWTFSHDAVITFVSAEDWFNKRISEHHDPIYKDGPLAFWSEVACDPNDWFKSVYEQNKSAIFIEEGSDSELNSHRRQLQQEKQK